MSINLESSNVATRENRIGSITGYIGTLGDLAEKSGCGTLKGCSRCFSQSSTCLSRHPGSTVWAIKNGTPAVYVADEYMIFGYKHTLEFARSVLDSINNRSFEKNLAKRVKLPYTDWWYRQNVDKFLEEGKK